MEKFKRLLAYSVLLTLAGGMFFTLLVGTSYGLVEAFTDNLATPDKERATVVVLVVIVAFVVILPWAIDTALGDLFMGEGLLEGFIRNIKELRK